MPQISIIFGLALCGLTVFGMVGTAEKLATAFVPMMLGIPLVFCGVVSLNPHRRRSWMRVAAVVATAGLVSAAGRLIYQSGAMMRGNWVNHFSYGLLWGIVILCGAFLVLMAIDAWRNRRRRKPTSADSETTHSHSSEDAASPPGQAAACVHPDDEATDSDRREGHLLNGPTLSDDLQVACASTSA